MIQYICDGCQVPIGPMPGGPVRVVIRDRHKDFCQSCADKIENLTSLGNASAIYRDRAIWIDGYLTGAPRAVDESLVKDMAANRFPLDAPNGNRLAGDSAESATA